MNPDFLPLVFERVNGLCWCLPRPVPIISVLFRDCAKPSEQEITNYGVKSVNAPLYGYNIFFGFEASNDIQTNMESIGFGLLSKTTSSLIVGNYTFTSPLLKTFPNGTTIREWVAGYSTQKLIGINPDRYDIKKWIDESSDVINVGITKIENGYVSGTFSFTATKEGGTEKLQITEGKFSNFKSR